MASHLVVASTVRPFEGPPIKSPQVFELMTSHCCWEFADAAPLFRKIVPGDLLVFYLGGSGARYFAGEAKVAGLPQPIDHKSSMTFDREHVPFFHWRMPLSDIRRYPEHIAGLDVVERLSFARESSVDPKFIGLLLKLGIRTLTRSDVAAIRRSVGAPSS